MRNMSFMLTTQQVEDGTKDVTRRFGWDFLKVGERVMACEKCQGLGKGGKINRLRPIEIVSVQKERADAITGYDDPAQECAREGFPEMTAAEFVAMLCKANKRQPSDTVNRIEFRYID
ncbi:hypothetical protein [Hwanghaeella sp.]|uniref:hypothetical protein n=1 Tax=Hwanghaeella sp. TaxID=2605943 RepID=UPI003CCC135A